MGRLSSPCTIYIYIFKMHDYKVRQLAKIDFFIEMYVCRRFLAIIYALCQGFK